MNKETLENKLYDWAFATLGELIPVVWARKNMARPKLSYVEIYISSNDREGVDYVSETAYDDAIVVAGNRSFIVQIQTFGSGAFDNISKLRISLENPLVNFALAQSGIIYIAPMGNIIDVAALVGENRWEERFQIDLQFRMVESELVVVSTIEHVDGQVAVKQGPIERLININL
jgi:hypothetical protein